MKIVKEMLWSGPVAEHAFSVSIGIKPKKGFSKNDKFMTMSVLLIQQKMLM